MKKKAWLLLLVVVILASAIAIIQRPDAVDYASWMENTYELQCLDEMCDTFQIEEDNETILLQSVRGGNSPGIFMMKITNTYRNYEDPSYQLDLDVVGFFGKIMIKSEKVKKINKR
ncbi:hypothetical protein [Mesobacillus selenatarsenatis]|uniref:DUF4359 domain-containing protein n=1 Tax=Mesobacillus selenatarsenatis TaxID=388741 RepID=A0A846TVU5_9BACI|nr:hypothetical protein [Mesobacillus selenatarsenatis]NKE05856.1 hypothetical protein [Mesobacillus selenatarsenatis]